MSKRVERHKSQGTRRRRAPVRRNVDGGDDEPLFEDRDTPVGFPDKEPSDSTAPPSSEAGPPAV